MSVSDLTGTSWYFNSSSISSLSEKTINFTSDGDEGKVYTGISVVKVINLTHMYYLYGSSSSTTAWKSNGGWTNVGHRTIHITGGTHATNSTLISWLESNATQIIVDDTLGYVGVNNQSSKITKGYVGVGNQSRKLVKGYIGVNNQAKKIF